jgi:multisubunit Na+/H+ antiporter MnhE subunit
MRWRFLLPLPVLAGLWLLLTDGDLESFMIGIPAVSAVYWAWRRGGDADQRLPSLFGLAYLLPHFLWNSVHSGEDVA